MLWQARPGFVAGRGALDAGSAFTPASLSPNLWIQPALGGLFQSNAGSTAATANSDVVGFIPDQSGNSFTLTSTADDTTRPTLQGVGSFPYLNFDGTNDLLRRAAGIGGGSYTAGATSWFMTIRATTPATASFMAGEFNSSDGDPAYSVFYSQTGSFSSLSGFFRDDAGSSLTGMFNTIVKSGAFDGSDHVIGFIDNGSTVTGYVDGVAGTPVAYTRGGKIITANLFVIGARMPGGTASQWMAHRMYGGVFANRVLNSTEIANLTTYMGNLAGLSL